MQAVSEEVEYLVAAAEELRDYLLSDSASWQLTGPRSFPALTPGYVLLYSKRCSNSILSSEATEKLKTALALIDEITHRWNSAWRKRIMQEIPQRLRLWENYLEDLDQSEDQAGQSYRWNVRWRTMLSLLGIEVNGLDQKSETRLEALDERLRAITIPGSFVWEQGLTERFPRTVFWFLYLTFPPLAGKD